MDKDIKHLIHDGITHVSIWVLAIVVLLFFKTPGCCKCKCNEQRNSHSKIHLIGTNVVLYADNVITNKYSGTMYISVSNKKENL